MTPTPDLDLPAVVRLVRSMPGLFAAVAVDRGQVVAASPDFAAALHEASVALGRDAELWSPVAQEAAEGVVASGEPARLQRVPVHVGDRLAHVDIGLRALPVPDEPSLALMHVEDVTLVVESTVAEQEAREEARATGDRYRMLFDHNQLGIVVHGPDGSLVDVNPAALRILGAASMHELLGRDSNDPRWQAVRADGSAFPGPEHPAMVTLRTGVATHGVIMGVADQSDGSRRWLRVSASPVRRRGEISAVVATFEDVTDRFILQRQLLRRTAVLDALMVASPVGFALIDAEHRFVQVNDALAHLAGTVPREVEGRPVEEVLPQLMSDRQAFDRVLHAGDSVTVVHLAGDRDDGPDADRAWRIDYRPVTVDDELIAVGCVVVDLTEHRRVERLQAELERERHRAELDAIARTLDEERKAVRVLQEAVIPTELPALDGAAVAARYVSASVGPNVGGDWFDVVAGPRDRTTVIIVGDVVGHGVVAARQMLQLRHWASLLASVNDTPATVLAALNRAVRRSGDGIMATTLVAMVDLEAHRLSWATAGHLPPVVRDGNGARVLDADVVGCPLGVVDHLVASDNVAPFPSASTLLCYTDGVVERPGEIIDQGLERLCRAAAASAPTPDALCDTVLDRLTDGDERRDDVCVVALRAT